MKSDYPRILYVFARDSGLDREMCRELERCLYALHRRSEHTTAWHEVPLGVERRLYIERHLREADVILLLLSPDFFASDACHEQMVLALEQRASRAARVIPIFLRPTLIPANSEISVLQALPDDDNPIALQANRDLAWKHIGERIGKTLHDVDPKLVNRAGTGTILLTASADQGATNAEPPLPPATTPTPIRVGSTIEKYKIVASIEGGTWSELFLAHHIGLRRECVIKAPNPGRTAFEEYSCYRERVALGIARSWGVVDIYDHGTLGDGRPFIVLEHLEGESLASRLARVRQLPIADALYAAWQVARAMEHVHGRGILHRDLKPHNLMLTPDAISRHGERIKIFDFNIASVPDRYLVDCGYAEREQFEATYAGAPAYSSPEQIRVEPLDVRTDIYTLGVTLYELLSGSRPFMGDLLEVKRKILTDEPPRLTQIARTIDSKIADMVHSMLDKKPANRPESMTAVAKAIEQFG